MKLFCIILAIVSVSGESLRGRSLKANVGNGGNARTGDAHGQGGRTGNARGGDGGDDNLVVTTPQLEPPSGESGLNEGPQVTHVPSGTPGDEMEGDVSGLQASDTITFDDPTHHGKLVDVCLSYQTDCGQPAADAFCAERNYGKAVAFQQRRSYSEETLTLAEHTTCTPSHNVCSGFAFITCLVPTQTFENPMEHVYPLEGCYEWETSCDGKDAADAFCEDKGYKEAAHFSLVECQDMTMTIGDHAVCDPNWHQCSSFSYITCVV